MTNPITNNSLNRQPLFYDFKKLIKNDNSASPIVQHDNNDCPLNITNQEVLDALGTANAELQAASIKFQWPWSKPDKEDVNNETQNDDSTRDGEIGNSSQNGTGNCALLSAINALSYTNQGKQIIKNALEYKENGDVVVRFKGVGDYTVTKE